MSDKQLRKPEVAYERLKKEPELLKLYRQLSRLRREGVSLSHCAANLGITVNTCRSWERDIARNSQVKSLVEGVQDG